MLSYTPTPIQEISNELLQKVGVRLFIKREDLNHPHISGNKWWKLKYNLEEALKQNKKTILTFGGAYSNHLYATAAACKELRLSSIGMVRGEETLPLNNTLKFCRSVGMQHHYISREAYRNKDNKEITKALQDQFGDFYLIPEGGTNQLAIKGVEEFAKNLPTDFDYYCLVVGTGGTIAGLIKGLPNNKKIIGFSALKGDFLSQEVSTFVGDSATNWEIKTNYHFGGYAKTSSALVEFIHSFEKEFNIPLEQVYTGKGMFAVLDMIQRDHFKPNSKILFIHSGGLQGRNF